MVARQFIAWFRCKKGNRPVGNGMIGADRRATIQDDQSTVGKDQTVPYGTDSRLNLFQAMNCLATIISSLRDNTLNTCLRIRRQITLMEYWAVRRYQRTENTSSLLGSLWTPCTPLNATNICLS